MGLIAGLDTETTGLRDPAHRIIELALLLYDTDTRKKVGEFVRRWNPNRPIDPKAQAVHGISLDQVAHLPTMEQDVEGIAMIQKIAGRVNYVVAHNGFDFDVPFLFQEFARIGQILPEFRHADTMVQGGWATPMGKKPNLGELCFACRVPYDPSQAHGATYDVSVMMDSWFYGLQRGFFTAP